MALLFWTGCAVFSLAVVGVRGQALTESGDSWLCRPVTPQRDVTLDKILGRWHLAEIYSEDGFKATTDACNSFSFSQTDSVVELTSESLWWSPAGTVTNFTLREPSTPWLWDVTGRNFSVATVFLSADGNTLIQSPCFTIGDVLDVLVLTKHLPLSEAANQEVVNFAQNLGLSRSGKGYRSWLSLTCN